MGRYYADQAPQIDPTGWGQYVVQLLGAGGVGFLLRELVKQAFRRAQENDDNQTVKRGELREQVAALTSRVDVLTERLDRANERTNKLITENAELKAENRSLRQRWHALMNWLSVQPELPTPPAWLYERVQGPTETRPPEATS